MEHTQFNLEINPDTRVKDFLLMDIKTAHVFEKYGIDFCCKGYKNFNEVCEEKEIDKNSILNEIYQIVNHDESAKPKERFEEWNLDFLSDYIVNNHHNYVRNAIPQITEHLDRVTFKHGDKNPFLYELKSTFDSLKAEMLSHIEKEEKILFHLIKYLVDCKRFEEKPKLSGFKSVEFPIKSMLAEHDNAGESTARIREITNNYNPPEDACNTFRLTYSELEEFEKDLHIHVHLENNILFPKAISLEQELSAKN